jgi:hypothetical protein
VAFERLDVNGPVPASANDLSQSLRVVLIRLVDLHLEGGVPSREWLEFEGGVISALFQRRESALARRDCRFQLKS